MNNRFLCSLLIFAFISSTRAYQLPDAPARLASWPAKVDQTGAFYQVLPQMFNDKVTVQETSFNGFNHFLYTVLEDCMPPSWYPIAPKVSINFFDATDALTLAALIPSAAIMQEALRLMPTTKAFEKCEQPYGTSKKVDATPVALMLANTIESKINRCRLTKLFLPAGLLLLYATKSSLCKSLRKITSLITSKPLFPFAGNDRAIEDNTALKSYERVFDFSCAGIKLALAQRGQNELLCEGIACFTLLLTASTITIDQTVVRQCLNAIANKLTIFDGASACAAQYQALAEHIA